MGGGGGGEVERGVAAWWGGDLMLRQTAVVAAARMLEAAALAIPASLGRLEAIKRLLCGLRRCRGGMCFTSRGDQSGWTSEFFRVD